MSECGPDCTCEAAQKTRALAQKILDRKARRPEPEEPFLVMKGPFKGRVYQRTEKGLVRRRALEGEIALRLRQQEGVI